MLFPDNTFQNYKTKQKILLSIKGFTSLTANQIVNNIPEFLSFIKEINFYKINLSYQKHQKVNILMQQLSDSVSNK